MDIKQLRARLSEIRDEAQAIVDAADANTENPGHMSDEQAAQFDSLMSEREQVEESIKRLETLEGMEQPAPRQTKQPQPKDPVAQVRPRVEDDPMRGFKDAGDFALSVKSASLPGGEFDERLKVLGAPTGFHRETSSADGYMVPPQVREEVWSLVFANEGILSSVSPEPTESNQVQLYADETTPWSSDGIQANWASEGNQFSPTSLVTNARNVSLDKLYAFVLATEEILEDAPRLQNRVTQGAAAAIRWKADESIVNGDGVGKPLGWFNSGALITVAKEGSQSADTVVAANVLKMYSRLLQIGSAGAYWLVHQSVIPQLATMTIGDQPVWTPPNQGLVNAPGGMLLGLPVRLSEHAQTLGDKGDIQLVAPQGYYAAVKAGGIKFAASMHLYFDYDIQAFRWTFRMGGQPMLSAPISQAKGSQTLSHFITLAERT